jgi:hypothetical protein
VWCKPGEVPRHLGLVACSNCSILSKLRCMSC